MVLTKNNINIITASLLFLLNLLVIFIDKSGGYDRIASISITIMAFIFIVVLRNKNIYFFYSMVGVLITVFGGADNLSGAIFFFISAYDKKTKTNIFINIILCSLSLFIKSYFMEKLVPEPEYTIAHIFSLLIGFFFVLSHMYVRFWNISEIKSKIGLNKGLTVEQLQTIEKLIEGKGHSQSAKELNIERTTFSARIGSIRKRYNVSNDFQLAIMLIEDNVISLNTLTNAKIDD